ncbi:hypothetical protein [Acinetobacter tianfuensis]|uniref:Lipoprotein n=1 Tax=Acinetobacter tianfuensis TaxID=2419603 RepID=A0A3A8EKD6_9GAMM|nr:hypothetical protein [Acinetobacter tianfuensis]RKG34628.1 hypothetical protein D7V32_00735 [Acinetobacter tianfuensis]
MRNLAILSLTALLSGCIFGSSGEIRKAEKLLAQFKCANIESSQMSHSSITSFHEQKLSSSKQKALSYIESYKAGDALFDLPLDQVIEQQFNIYKASCQNLGGIPRSETAE